MADDADQALPGLALFLAQRLTQVGEHQELVRPAALAELAPANLPASDAARERRVDDARGVSRQAVVEIELARLAREQPLRRLAEQAGAGTVDELEDVMLVESEHRDFDLGHDLAQQGRRFERVEPLMAERLDQRVDLDHDLAERIAAARAAGPNREVTLAQRGEQVRERLQRQDDALAQREREAEAEADDENCRASTGPWAYSRRSRERSAR